MQHAHVCKLIDHHPVVAPALCLSTVTALDAQVDGVEVPEERQQKHTALLFKENICGIQRLYFF